MEATTTQGYIKEPTLLQEYVHNAQFQLDNLVGWMSVRNYESALIKAKLLVEALEKTVAVKHA